MTVPKLLIYSGFYPGNHGTGCMLLRDACRCYPRDRVCCYSLTQREPSDTEYAWVPTRFGDPAQTYLPQVSAGRIERLLQLPFRSVAEGLRNRNVVKEAVAFGRSQGVEMVCAVMDYATNLSTAERIADGLRVPLVTVVWDPLEYKTLAEGHTRAVRWHLMRQFESLMRRSIRCGVASDEMAEAYRQRYGKECVVLRMGTSPADWKEPHTGPLNPGKLNVIMAGSVYALEEMQALVDALNEVGWTVCGREVTLTVLSMSPFPITLKKPARVHMLGFHSPKEALMITSQADVGYLPYWFRADRKLAVQLSFPGKMGSYLSAGLPVLFHGPAASTPMTFFKKYPMAVACNSMDRPDMIRALETLATDPDVYRRAARAGRAALQEELGLPVYVRRFAKLVGANPDEMLPLQRE